MRPMTDSEIKAKGLEILLDVDAFCRKHGIEYFLVFGTLLGAVRHGGFIPWDDDVDIGMTRDHYNRFIDLMQREQDKYRILSIETSPDYPFTFARVSDQSTHLDLRGVREIHGLGIFVDVFPYDHAFPPEERDKGRLTCHRMKMRVRATVPSTAKFQAHSLRSFYKYLRGLPFRLLHGKDFDHYRHEFQNYLMQYNDRPCDAYQSQRPLFIFPREVLFPCREIEFEGHRFMAPADPREYLRIKFGDDYMQFPPVEKRVTRHHFTAYWKEGFEPAPAADGPSRKEG